MDKEPREKWISQIEKHQPFNYYLADFWVCEHHFDPSSVYCKSFRKFLFKGAFPTNFTGQKAKEPGKKKRKSVKTKSINDANKLGITEKIEPIENNDVAECNITIKTEQPDVVGADLDNLFETIDPDSLWVYGNFYVHIMALKAEACKKFSRGSFCSFKFRTILVQSQSI